MRNNIETIAENARKELSGWNKSTDLYINKEHGIAALGVQHSGQVFATGEYFGKDDIYVIKENGMLWRIAHGNFPEGGRLFPKGISEDGKELIYVARYGDDPKRHNEKYDLTVFHSDNLDEKQYPVLTYSDRTTFPAVHYPNCLVAGRKIDSL